MPLLCEFSVPSSKDAMLEYTHNTVLPGDLCEQMHSLGQPLKDLQRRSNK